MIKIGTRESKLALIQANKVKNELLKIGVNSELVIIKSAGDENQSTALNNFSNPGVFTKALDNAILENRIDVAVHSCKDLPSEIESEIEIIAVLNRDSPFDVLVPRKSIEFLSNKNYNAKIATGSVRRKAQWLSEYPNHIIIPIRGNIDTRLKKLYESDWDGLIIAEAAINRLQLLIENKIVLNNFIPSPCQGIIAITSNRRNASLIDVLKKINHQETYQIMQTERAFLKEIQIGCSSPIGGLAKIHSQKITFDCEIYESNGKNKIQISKTVKLNDYLSLGKNCARELKQRNQQLLDET